MANKKNSNEEPDRGEELWRRTEESDRRQEMFQRALESLMERQSSGAEHLERVDGVLEKLVTLQEQLFRSQVILTDVIEKLTQNVEHLRSRINDLAEAGRRSDERLNRILHILDDLVWRRQPPIQ